MYTVLLRKSQNSPAAVSSLFKSISLPTRTPDIKAPNQKISFYFQSIDYSALILRPSLTDVKRLEYTGRLKSLTRLETRLEAANEKNIGRYQNRFQPS